MSPQIPSTPTTPTQKPPFKYTSPRTKKTYEFKWDKPDDPTPDDFSALEKYVSDLEADEQAPSPPSVVPRPISSTKSTPGFISRTMEPIVGMGSFLKKSGKAITGDLASQAEIAEGFAEPFKQFAANKAAHPHERVGNLVASLAGYNPEAMKEDWNTGNYGALAGDVIAPTVMNIAGARLLKGIKNPEALPKTPKVPVVPDVTPPVIPPTGPGSFVEIPKKVTPPWDFGADVRQFPDPYSPQRSQGIGARPEVLAPVKKVPTIEFDEMGQPTIKRVPKPIPFNEEAAAAMRHKKISGEKLSGDWLADDPFYATIPERLRPEAPNVAALKTTAEGAGKMGGAVKRPRIQFIDEADYLKQREAVAAAEKAGDTTVRTNIELPKVQENIELPKAKGPAEVIGKPGKAFYKDFVEKNPELKGIMTNLIRKRSSGDLIGKGLRDRFKDISHLTKDNLIEFQEGMKAGKYPEVAKYYEDMHKELTDKGIEMGKKENYLPQLWENTPEEVAKAFGDKELNQKASFQYKSFIEDYKTGIEKGLTPKMGPSELVEWYGKRANKLLADQEALQAFKDKGYLVTSKDATSNMKKMDPNLGAMEGYYADPAVKQVIENYLKSSENIGGGLTGDIAKKTGKLSNIVLSSGLVPGKPLFTAQGLNIGGPLGRAWMEGGMKRQVQALKYGWSPERAAKLLETDNAAMVDATRKYGAKFSTEDIGQGPKFFENEIGRFGTGAVKKGVNKLTELQNKYFENDVFNKMVPAIKWEAWKDNFAKFQKQGMSEAEAGSAATKITDSYYSGRNVDELFNNKTFNDLYRSTFIAPDWLRSSADLGINVPKSLAKAISDPKNPAARVYQKTAARVMGAYVAANLIEKATTGKFLVEKPVDEMFTMSAGEDVSGQKKRGVRLFGSSADFFSLPIKAAKATMEKGGGLEVASEFVENRMSPLVRGASLLKGEDYKGEPNIFSTTDRFGNEVPTSKRLENTLSQVINMGPPHSSQIYGAATGRVTPEEAVARIGEFPLSYKKKKKIDSPLGLGGLGGRKNLFEGVLK